MSLHTGIERTDLDSGITVWRIAIVRAADRSARREGECEAVRRLVAEAFGPPATLCHEESGAPYVRLDDTILRSLSITHCSDTAMLATAPEGTAIGIDCEHFRGALRNVAPRILSAEELAPWTASDALLLRAWTIKEAVYKAALAPGLPFADGIRLPAPDAPLQVATIPDGRRFRLITLPSATIAISLTQL